MLPIESLTASAYRVPTATVQESDGTAVWSSTTLVLAKIAAGNLTGIGFTYADVATAHAIVEHFAPAISGKDATEIRRRWLDMWNAVRNMGRAGVTMMALSAVDVALWDLNAKLLGVPAFRLLGTARDALPVYGSGGFTSYDVRALCDQLGGWVEAGIPRVKMKVGREPLADPQRVAAARDAIGDDAELFVDANGAYDVPQAIALARRFAESSVSWLEEPVPQQDAGGLRDVRRRAPPGMAIAAGEYGYVLGDFVDLLVPRAVDVLQADATRCGGFTGLLAADALARSMRVPLSTHCAPYLHLHAALACASLRHSEYFFDHARIEAMLFDGPAEPKAGMLQADPQRPGMGLTFKERDAERYAS